MPSTIYLSCLAYAGGIHSKWPDDYHAHTNVFAFVGYKAQPGMLERDYLVAALTKRTLEEVEGLGDAKDFTVKLKEPGILERFMLVYWQHYWRGTPEKDNFKTKIRQVVKTKVDYRG